MLECKTSPSPWRLLLSLISCAAIAYALWFAWQVHVAEAYGDYWSWTTQYERWRAGNFSLADLISSWNEHRIATARLVFLADTLLFRMTGVLPSAILLLCQAACGLIIYRLGGRARAALLPWWFWVAWMLGTCQSDNLEFPFQVQFGLLALFAVASVTSLASASRAAPARAFIFGVLGSICFFAATFSMAAGLMLAPILLALIVVLRAPWQMLAGWLPLSIAAVVLFLRGYVLPDRHAATQLGSIPHRVIFVAHFLASFYSAVPGSALAVGAGLLFVFSAISAWLLKSRGRGMAPADAALIAIAGFVVLCGVSGALTPRALLGDTAALASRYASLGLLFAAAMGQLIMRHLPDRSRHGIWQPVLQIMACLLLASVNLPTYLKSAVLSSTFIRTNDDLLANGVGVEGPMFSFFGPFARDLGPQTDFLRQHKLNMFAPWMRPPRASLAAIAQGEAAPSCLGQVDHVISIDAHAILVDGWIAAPSRRSVRWVVARENGRVVGAAQTFPAQEDLAPALAAATHPLGFATGFRLHEAEQPDIARHYDVFGILPGKKPNVCQLQLALPAPQLQIAPLREVARTMRLPVQATISGDAVSTRDVPVLPGLDGNTIFRVVPAAQSATLTFLLPPGAIPAASDVLLPFQGLGTPAHRAATFSFPDGSTFSADLYWPWDKPQILAVIVPRDLLGRHPGALSIHVDIERGPEIMIGDPLAGTLNADWSKLF